MIRIKTVDAQNILDVCRLTTHQDCIGAAAAGHPCCNAIAIAETATICRFMIGDTFRHKGIEENAL